MVIPKLDLSKIKRDVEIEHNTDENDEYDDEDCAENDSDSDD